MVPLEDEDVSRPVTCRPPLRVTLRKRNASTPPSLYNIDKVETLRRAVLHHWNRINNKEHSDVYIRGYDVSMDRILPEDVDWDAMAEANYFNNETTPSTSTSTSTSPSVSAETLKEWWFKLMDESVEMPSMATDANETVSTLQACRRLSDLVALSGANDGLAAMNDDDINEGGGHSIVTASLISTCLNRIASDYSDDDDSSDECISYGRIYRHLARLINPTEENDDSDVSILNLHEREALRLALHRTWMKVRFFASERDTAVHAVDNLLTRRHARLGLRARPLTALPDIRGIGDKDSPDVIFRAASTSRESLLNCTNSDPRTLWRELDPLGLALDIDNPFNSIAMLKHGQLRTFINNYEYLGDAPLVSATNVRVLKIQSSKKRKANVLDDGAVSSKQPSSKQLYNVRRTQTASEASLYYLPPRVDIPPSPPKVAPRSPPFALVG